MNTDLTGRENMRLFGLYQKMSAPEAARLEDDVVGPCELVQFIDIPVRTYSAGMTLRLSFAPAIAVRPEILITNEWFLAGDVGFVEKARHWLESTVRGDRQGMVRSRRLAGRRPYHGRWPA